MPLAVASRGTIGLPPTSTIPSIRSSMSLTLGGHVSSGLNIRLGEQKDFALTLEGRYTLAHFTNALGSPGDFSGLSLAVGFGKYF